MFSLPQYFPKKSISSELESGNKESLLVHVNQLFFLDFRYFALKFPEIDYSTISNFLGTELISNRKQFEENYWNYGHLKENT